MSATKFKAIVSLIVWTAVLGMCTQFSYSPGVRAETFDVASGDGYTNCTSAAPFSYAIVDNIVIQSVSWEVDIGDFVRFTYNYEYDDSRFGEAPEAVHTFTIRVDYSVGDFRLRTFKTYGWAYGDSGSFTYSVYVHTEDTWLSVKWQASVEVSSPYRYTDDDSGWYEIYLD